MGLGFAAVFIIAAVMAIQYNKPEQLAFWLFMLASLVAIEIIIFRERNRLSQREKYTGHKAIEVTPFKVSVNLDLGAKDTHKVRILISRWTRRIEFFVDGEKVDTIVPDRRLPNVRSYVVGEEEKHEIEILGIGKDILTVLIDGKEIEIDAG